MYTEHDFNYHKYLPVTGMILFFIAGFLAAYLWVNIKVQKVSENCAVSLAESQKAGNSFPQVPKVQLPNEIFSISGKVENIDGQKISLKSLSFGVDKAYQVAVGSDTKIIKREIDLSPPKEGASGPTAPKKTDIKIADIRIGDSLTIDSSENIKDKTEFEAKTIYLELTTGLPAPSPLPDMNSTPAPPAASQGGAIAPPMPPTIPSSSGVPTAPAVPGAPPAAPAAPK